MEMEIGYFILGAIGIFGFLYVLIASLSNKKLKPATKALWITAGLFFNILTAIAYYIFQEK